MSDITALSAKEHFVTVAAGKIPEALITLSDAVCGGDCLRHHRDYYALDAAATKFLGRDIEAEQIKTEWDALSAEEQNIFRDNTEGLGKYSLFKHISKPEVMLALAVVGKLLSKDFSLSAHNAQRLNDPKMVKLITTRFPILREADIAEALQPQ